jgi:hypothetical protein
LKLFKYNGDRLTFERSSILIKYRVLTSTLCSLLFLTTSYTITLNIELKSKNDIISQKNLRIISLRTPLREETYVEDIQKAIGFKLTNKQHKEFTKLALKYKEQIEEAKVPATLVWWIAFKESGFQKDVKNPKSSSKGLFGFIDGTWNEVCKMKGYNNTGRFREEKQVRVLLDYLNYLYNKYNSWEGSMFEYHGRVYQYPVLFLFK